MMMAGASVSLSGCRRLRHILPVRFSSVSASACSAANAAASGTAPSPRALAAFFDGGHFTPTPLYCIAWGDGCGPSYVDPDIYASITKTSILAFLEHNRGYEGAWEQIVEDPAVVEWELNLE